MGNRPTKGREVHYGDLADALACTGTARDQRRLPRAAATAHTDAHPRGSPALEAKLVTLHTGRAMTRAASDPGPVQHLRRLPLAYWTNPARGVHGGF